MSDSEQQETEPVSQPQWPENGDQWSDWEDETDMDCGLLQVMAEEDADIDFYNDETFGMDLDADDASSKEPIEILLTSKEPPLPLPPVPQPVRASPPSPPPPRCLPSPPRQRPQYLPRGSMGQRGRGRGQRGGQGRGQMFEDPAVMRTVEGRPSLKSLDSAIVDCGTAMLWDAFDQDWTVPSYRKTRRISGSILQDNAIVCVIDGHGGRDHHAPSNFLDFPCPMASFRGRRAVPRVPYLRRPVGYRGPSQMHAPMMPGSPVFSRQPLTLRQHFNQTGAFLFPLNRPCTPTPQPLTPKMMQLRFGANSPRPSPFYSPSSNPVQHFRYPGPVTQLHPQHKRLLSQKLFSQRSVLKPDGWDTYCNLMTAKEKEWITRLQMIQLQSENPYHEDYYYQEYYRRIEAKMAEEELGIRSKREPPKLTTPYITKTDSYAPGRFLLHLFSICFLFLVLSTFLRFVALPVVHIEGSLGQVAVSTCYAPRHAISAVHAVQAQGPLEELKDTRQQRLEVLIVIEKLFVVMLEVEEAERMKATVLAEAEEKKLMMKTQRKVEHIYSQLQHHDPLDSGGEFLPCLLVSKGKKLLARLLPFLDRDSALNILHVVTSNLPTLMSRDTDESLPVIYQSLRTVIGGLTFSQLIVVLKDLTLPESPMTHECLTLACQNKFGLSLLYALLSQGERLLSSGVPLEPSIGDFETWTDTIFQVAGQLSQCSLVEPLLLPSNLLTLFCRYLDKRTVHQLKSNMESVTGFLALPS
ncbi:protein PAT1 homolog 2 [Diretmus argenteus]